MAVPGVVVIGGLGFGPQSIRDAQNLPALTGRMSQ
jgi:hypothetical protein